MKPAIPWATFSAAALGVIMMGGAAWAYSLAFERLLRALDLLKMLHAGSLTW